MANKKKRRYKFFSSGEFADQPKAPPKNKKPQKKTPSSGGNSKGSSKGVFADPPKPPSTGNHPRPEKKGTEKEGGFGVVTWVTISMVAGMLLGVYLSGSETSSKLETMSESLTLDRSDSENGKTEEVSEKGSLASMDDISKAHMENIPVEFSKPTKQGKVLPSVKPVVSIPKAPQKKQAQPVALDRGNPLLFPDEVLREKLKNLELDSKKISKALEGVSKAPKAKNKKIAKKKSKRFKKPRFVRNLKIEDIRIQDRPSSLKVKFSVRNLGRNQKSGHIYAIAKFQKEDGTIGYIASPSELKVTKRGQVLNPESGVSFKINTLVYKEVGFKNLPHEIKGLKLVARTSDGGEVSTTIAPAM